MPYNCRYSGMMGSLSGLGSDTQSEHETKQVLSYLPLVKNYDDVYTCYHDGPGFPVSASTLEDGHLAALTNCQASLA